MSLMRFVIKGSDPWTSRDASCCWYRLEAKKTATMDWVFVSEAISKEKNNIDAHLRFV